MKESPMFSYPVGTLATLRASAWIGSLLGLLLGLNGCAGLSASTSLSSPDAGIHSAFTVQTKDGNASARVITSADRCPEISIDGQTQAMQLRAAPGTMPLRSGAQKDAKEAVFPLRSCEAPLPRGTASAKVGGVSLPLAPAVAQRILIIADTGCRLKASDQAFQLCNDAKDWPFAEVVKSAAALKPDLVIHIGDMHYRESPCPATLAGCAGSPWGYGMDAWTADFFQPAQPLLKIAPWVFVRGNHESCARAGQGWYRFFAVQPWSAARSCNDPANDDEADFPDPYGVPLNADTQLIVFDSSRTGTKDLRPGDTAYGKFLSALQQVDQLSGKMSHNFFLSHHPVLAFAPASQPGKIYNGNPGLQSVMRTLHPGRLFGDEIDVAMHGHVHLFEALNFSSQHPTSFVLGNSGSQNEGALPEVLPAGAQPSPGAMVASFLTRSAYGFALLTAKKSDWHMTEYTVDGKPIIECDLVKSTSNCRRVGVE